MNFTVISELSTSTADYEALWIEIHNTHGLNILCGIIYRHLNGNLESFYEYLNSTAEKIDRGGICEEELPKKPVGRLLADCWPTVGRQFVLCLRPKCWPTVGQQSADSR